MKKRPLVIIEWDDAFGNNHWRSEAELQQAKPMRCTTVGWRMPSEKGYFSIAATRDEQGRCTDSMTLPRGNVKSIKKLSVENGTLLYKKEGE